MKNSKNNQNINNISADHPLSLLKLITCCIVGVVIVPLLYFFMSHGQDINFSQTLHQLLFKSIWYDICIYIGHIFSTKTWLILMLISFILYFASLFNKAIFNKNTRKNILWFGLSLFIVAAVAGVLKFVIGRYRPYALINNQILINYKHFCLKDICHASPSGHSCLSAAALYCFSKIFNKWWLTIICALLAVTIALSRVVIYKHYVSDVVFGLYLGLICVLWAQWIINIGLINLRLTKLKK